MTLINGIARSVVSRKSLQNAKDATCLEACPYYNPWVLTQHPVAPGNGAWARCLLYGSWVSFPGTFWKPAYFWESSLKTSFCFLYSFSPPRFLQSALCLPDTFSPLSSSVIQVCLPCCMSFLFVSILCRLQNFLLHQNLFGSFWAHISMQLSRFSPFAFWVSSFLLKETRCSIRRWGALSTGKSGSRGSPARSELVKDWGARGGPAELLIGGGPPSLCPSAASTVHSTCGVTRQSDCLLSWPVKGLGRTEAKSSASTRLWVEVLHLNHRHLEIKGKM